MLTITKKTKLADIKSAIGCSTVSKNKAGNYIARNGYYYRHGATEDDFAERILKKIQNIEVVDTKDIWKPFKGGASVANQSHFYVEFKIA